jgi:hypothetical protein
MAKLYFCHPSSPDKRKQEIYENKRNPKRRERQLNITPPITWAGTPRHL